MESGPRHRLLEGDQQRLYDTIEQDNKGIDEIYHDDKPINPMKRVDSGVLVEEESDEDTTEFVRGTNGNWFTIEDAVDNMGCGLFQAKFFAICGLFSATDALEMLLLAVLSPALRCEWMLEDYQVASLTTMVFAGMFVGSFFWGGMADKYGRFSIVYLNACFILYYGILTTFSPNFIWVLVCRLLVGFSFGGAVQSFTLLSEYIPTKMRAKLLLLSSLSWAIGSTFEIILAYLVIPTLGWRYLVAFSALPSLISLFALWFLPESARFLLASGDTEKATEILAKASKMNNVKLPLGQLAKSKQSSRGCFSDLFVPKYRRTTIQLYILWFGAAFTYFGIMLLSSQMLEAGNYCTDEPKTDLGVSGEECHCKLLNAGDYKSMLISTFGEFLAIPLNLITVDVIGRRGTLVMNYALAGVGFLMLNVCLSWSGLTAVLFFIRAFASGIFNIAYIYTSEVYPTTVRSIGIGSCSGMARLGSMITPFFAQVLVEKTQRGAILVYGVYCLFGAVIAYLLPIETMGRDMPQTIHCEEKRESKTKSTG